MKIHPILWPLYAMVIVFTGSSVVFGAKPPITGWLEGVHIEGIEPRLRAKLDSGALTSSIHGTNWTIFERDGERWLRFDFHWFRKSRDEWFGPFTLEAPLVRKVLIKDHEDDSSKRPVVLLNMSLSGECNLVQFSVVDRTGFNYPVLLGRRFLAGKAIIDPRKTFTKATERPDVTACKPFKPASTKSQSTKSHSTQEKNSEK